MPCGYQSFMAILLGSQSCRQTLFAVLSVPMMTIEMHVYKVKCMINFWLLLLLSPYIQSKMHVIGAIICKIMHCYDDGITLLFHNIPYRITTCICVHRIMCINSIYFVNWYFCIALFRSLLLFCFVRHSSVLCWWWCCRIYATNHVNLSHGMQCFMIAKGYFAAQRSTKWNHICKMFKMKHSNTPSLSLSLTPALPYAASLRRKTATAQKSVIRLQFPLGMLAKKNWETSRQRTKYNLLSELLKIVVSPFSYAECVQRYSVIYFINRRLINLFAHTHTHTQVAIYVSYMHRKNETDIEKFAFELSLCINRLDCYVG